MFNNLIIKVMKKILFLAAVTAIALAACTKTETTGVSEGNLIKFDNAFVGNPTKAGLATDNQFGSTKTPDCFYVLGGNEENASLFGNIKVSKSDNSWIYSPVVAWNQSQAGKYKFVAYYTGTEKNDNASFTYADKSISISNVTSDQDNQTDVLLAVSDETLATNVPISFGFRHALSMIKFTLTSKIGDIAISDFTVSGFKSTGTVTMNDADEISWTVPEEAPAATFTLDNFTATTKGASSNEFVVIPQSGVNLKVTFKAVINEIEKTLTADMPNQSYGNSYRYNYTAEITGADMDVIQFNAPVVSDWEDYTDVTIDVDKTN